MKTKKFKTLKGLCKFAGKVIPVSRILNEEFFIYPNRYRIILEGTALEQFATMLAEYLYKGRKQQEQIREAVIRHQSDRGEYLQCFFLYYDTKNDTIFINNCLSGEAFEYCRRKFLKQL